MGRLVELESGDLGYVNVSSTSAESLIVYLNVTSVITPFFTAWVLFLAGCVAIALSKREKRFRVVLGWMWGALVMTLLLHAVCLLGLWVRDWDERLPLCDFLARTGTLAYMLANICMYHFLLIRARASAMCIQQSAWIQKLTKVLSVLTWLAPLLSVYVVSMARGSTLHAPELEGSPSLCVYRPDTFATALVLALDTSLSIGYLMVFAWPVLQIERRHRRRAFFVAEARRSTSASESASSTLAGASSKVLRAVMRNNLRASAAAIFSTFVFLVVLAVGTALEADNNSPQLLFLTWSMPFAALDTTINVTCIAFMTGVWLPDCLRRRHGGGSHGNAGAEVGGAIGVLVERPSSAGSQDFRSGTLDLDSSKLTDGPIFSYDSEMPTM